MTHPIEDLTALLDGALPPGRAAEVARHLASCAPCRAERDRLAAGIALLRALPPPPEPSPFFAARLEARIAREGRRRRSWVERLGLLPLRWRIAAPAAAAAIAAAAVLAGVRSHRADEAELARHLDLLLDYEVVASLGDVESEEDAALVAVLDELDELEGRKGRP